MQLLGQRPQDLAAFLEGRVDDPLDVSRRVLGHVVAEGRGDLELRRPISKRLRAELSEVLSWQRPTLVERHADPIDEGTEKFLFRAEDGALFEAVLIPLHKPGRSSVCLSSQAGCAMGCRFCATGRLGLSRNLTAAEIVGSWLSVRDAAPGRVTGAVFMGQGEPLHNYDAVIRAAQVLSEPCGGRISAKAISVSTVGLVPQMHRFSGEGHPFRLVLSLHAATDALRRELLPVASRWSLQELADAVRAHHAATGQRVTIAWVLLGGVNTDPAQAAALHALLGDVPLRINLIDVNGGDELGYRRATEDERNRFVDALQVLGMPVVRRYSVGRSGAAACGMLASRRLESRIEFDTCN